MAPAVAAILSEYPIEIIDFVTDPRTGLPSSQNFPATVKEVRDACDARYRPALDAARREQQIENQMAERARFEAGRALPKPTYEDLIQRCMDAGLPMRPEQTPRISADAVKAKYGIFR